MQPLVLLVEDQHGLYYVVELVYAFVALLLLEEFLLAMGLVEGVLLLRLGLSRPEVVAVLGVGGRALGGDCGPSEIVVGPVGGGPELVADAWQVPTDGGALVPPHLLLNISHILARPLQNEFVGVAIHVPKLAHVLL